MEGGSCAGAARAGQASKHRAVVPDESWLGVVRRRIIATVGGEIDESTSNG